VWVGRRRGGGWGGLTAGYLGRGGGGGRGDRECVGMFVCICVNDSKNCR